MDKVTLVDLRTAFDFAMTMVAVLGGWIWKTIDTRIKELERSDKDMVRALSDLRETLPSNYVQKEDFKGSLDSIHGVLRRIEDKLDNKVDKA